MDQDQNTDANEDAQADNVTVLENMPLKQEVEAEYSRSLFPFLNAGRRADGSVPLWLISFTDVMALMLTFFVMLYSMSVPKVEKWEEVSRAISSKFNKFENARAFEMGPNDVINIDRIRSTKALNLDYLQTLVSKLLEEKKIEDVLLILNGDRLIVSLPSKLLFESGRVQIKKKGEDVLFELGGILSHVKNRMEVIGHTDPRPVTSTAVRGYQNNWELSLARATSVASVLRDVGYEKDIVVRGLSSGRYDELSSQIPQDERYALSRRVDIVLMPDNGYSNGF